MKLKFSIFHVWTINSKFNFSKFIRLGKCQKFSAIKLSKSIVFSSIFIPILVQTNRVSLIFFVPSSSFRYLPSIYRIRETSHYSIRSRIRWNSNFPLKIELESANCNKILLKVKKFQIVLKHICWKKKQRCGRLKLNFNP